MVELICPQNGSMIELHTKEQDEFIERIKSDGTDSALEWLSVVKSHKEMQSEVKDTLKFCGIDVVRRMLDTITEEKEWGYSAPVKFHWETDAECSVFQIAENANFENPQTITTQDMTCEIRNLKFGQKYFWRVNECSPFVFETADVFPRFIKIDGLHNVRDIGDGLIRQGLVYRGSELNGTYNIKDEGRRVFCEELGIKTELDLRAEWFEKIGKSPAGENVQFIQLPYRPYKEVFEEEHKKGICKIMEVFADEANYPIYFHCMAGADRTGMIAMYLRAIMGVDEAEIHLDYDLTSLSSHGYVFNNEGFRRRTMSEYVELLDMLAEYAPGESLATQIIKFLDSCGVTEACREKIKSILIG